MCAQRIYLKPLKLNKETLETLTSYIARMFKNSDLIVELYENREKERKKYLKLNENIFNNLNVNEYGKSLIEYHRDYIKFRVKWSR